ncbi:MAG: hypothetical protein JWM91_5159 [Rhodospirillales bacterium]|nr:hypothetical protein [Rhodospirillales bacterium]
MSDLVENLKRDPVSFVDAHYNEGFALRREERDAIGLAGLQKRFAELRPALPALAKLAADQGIDAIRTIDDAAPLLFPHTAYKSYPLSFLERGQFDKLTRWLGGLTTIDLKGIDTTGIQTIDEWIALLEARTDINLIHTFGTTGKLSFLPRTKTQGWQTTTINAHCIRDFAGYNSGPDVLTHHMPLISPSYRHGASAIIRGMNRMAVDYAGGYENALFLYPDAYFSADVVSLAGRLRAAEARGEAGQLTLPPALLARRDEFAAREQGRAVDMDRFFAAAAERFSGQDVFLFAVWPILFEWAEEGLKRGLKGIFGPNSILTTGGGSKGKVLPPNYKDVIFEFLGFDRHFEFFGMSELMANAPRCAEGHFHFPPVIVPYVLDPATGQPLPRSGSQTGRLALMDLMPATYWGGLVSGDEVTMAGFDEPCACGRTGPYLEADIRRFSEAPGGDDKINCAGAPEAHDRAIDFLVGSTQ